MESNSLVSMIFLRCIHIYFEAYIVEIERPTIKRIGIGQNQLKLIAAVRAERRCFLKSMSIHIEIQCSNQYLWTKNSKILSVKWMANIYLLPFDTFPFNVNLVEKCIDILLRSFTFFIYETYLYFIIEKLCTAWLCALWMNSEDENGKMSINVEVLKYA